MSELDLPAFLRGIEDLSDASAAALLLVITERDAAKAQIIQSTANQFAAIELGIVYFEELQMLMKVVEPIVQAALHETTLHAEPDIVLQVGIRNSNSILLLTPPKAPVTVAEVRDVAGVYLKIQGTLARLQQKRSMG